MRVFLIVGLYLFSQGLVAQTTAFYVKARMLNGTFGLYHPKPIPLNATTSAEIIKLFISNLDHNASILKQADVTALNANAENLFSQIEAGKDGYIESAHRIYHRALFCMDSILAELALKSLNFNGMDSITFMPASSPLLYSKDIVYHARRLERYIKSRSYERVINSDGYQDLNEEQFNTKAREFSKTIIANFRKRLKNQLSESYATTESTLLNAIALRYDPHSNFFNEEQNSEFNQQLSASVESFGLSFDEDEDGVIVVSYVEPGGSAWMSNLVNEGDLFISAKIGNTSYTNEDIEAGDLQHKIETTTEKKISLSIKKQKGLLKTVVLTKIKKSSEENTVKSYILSAKGLNLGYISLPSFYTDMEDPGIPGCANDVAKELLKLEADTIQGLIFDLRNNGGGSMIEAMNLGGIFVDEGPLFIYKESNLKPTLKKDINRGSVFKKPVIVLINETSASASELFSNIVKDYNLGLVVGQTSYGKGTAQVVIPLDTNVLANKSPSKQNADFIKMTSAKFYRLNCSTHQGNGVVPDIALPKSPGFDFYKENKEPYFLPADSIVKKVVYTPNPAIDKSSLRLASEGRVRASANFKRYVLSSDSVNQYLYSPQVFHLNFKGFKAAMQKSDAMVNSFESASMADHALLSVRNNSFDKHIYEVDQDLTEFNRQILETLSKDFFIHESFLIFNDLIRLQNK